MKKINKRLIIILIAVTIAILGTMAATFKTGSSALSSGIGMVFAPAQRGAAAFVTKVSIFFENVKNSSANADENKRLKKKIAGLSDDIRMLEGYKTENEKLRKLLELKDNRQGKEYTAANIIGRDTSDVYNTLTIDKGTKDKIKKGAVVIVPDGLVGVVCEAGKNFAKVRTLLDAESAVSVICARSGDMGIAEGGLGAEKSECIMDFIDKEAKIVVGDSVETSGTGGIFPRGILVGKVKSIREDNRKLSLEAVIETGADLRRIREVLVSME